MSQNAIVKAIWKGAVLAESDDTILLEGNHYFPPESMHWEHLADSTSHTTCHWKGVASYHSVVVGDQRNEDAAWYYPEPSPAAQRIKDRIAFWHGIQVIAEKGVH